MKRIMEFVVTDNAQVHALYSLLTLEPQQAQDQLPPMRPGQFVQVATRNKQTYLRRPISINDFDTATRQLRLLVREAGDGTRWMTQLAVGDPLNLVLPLGNGFEVTAVDKRPLLVGGGVGVAPMLALAKAYCAAGAEPVMLIGARSKADVLEYDLFSKVCRVEVTTEDGSMGTKGLVTASEVWGEQFTSASVCGPSPMMKAVAALCREKGLGCRVSLENMMACGVGACLCCVEKTVKGNVCVCTEGPVFDIDQLTW